MSAGAEQYFARYAEPEAALAAAVPGTYLAALVVPARAESIQLLAGFEAALAAAPGRVLFILVVNAALDQSEATHAENARLLQELHARHSDRRPIAHPGLKTQGVLARAANHDLLWLDCASPEARLAPRTGVGTVRKLGGDLAAALWSRGQISCPRMASSDADVCLPADYFATLASEVAESKRSTAWLWPFSHEAGGDAEIDAATVLYEISLRYYVLALAAAGSGYAYQSIGSTLCVDVPSYLSVRGFPKREAGEDFYLLDKLAKVGPLRRALAAPVQIRARVSDRVPFGTGRRCREIAEQSRAGAAFELYCPRIFSALAAVLAGLNEFSASARVASVQEAVALRTPELAEPVQQVLAGLGVFSALASAASAAPVGLVLRRRVHTWFDALRTLRFVHGLRDRCLPSVPWREALSSASFLGNPWSEGSEPQAVCRALALAEARLPPQVGPTLG